LRTYFHYWVLIFALVLGAGLASAQPSRLYPEELTPVPVTPYVPSRAMIAVLGDSLGDGIWAGLVRRLVRDRRYVVFRGARNSTGFGANDLLDMIDKAFEAGRVDAVVMMVGANDRGGIYHGGTLVAPYKSPQWPHAYQARAEKFMDAVGKRGVPMIWILLPVMRDDGAESDSKLINRLIRQAAVDKPHVTLLDSRPLTSDAEGNFSNYLKDAKGNSRLVRHTDGVHFTDYGYELMSDAAFARLNEISTTLSLMALRK
jgi:hypothetical protein